MHKSFREYLYAEAIVDILKEYGKKFSGNLSKRERYWRDFGESDPRRQFSRDLSQVLCCRPLTREIRTHISGLLEWEVLESEASEGETQRRLTPESISHEQWQAVRDSLADLWDWWGEGVHLRPQPFRDDSDNLGYRAPLANEFVDYSLPRDRGPDAPEWWPGRLVNVDSNLGDALCRLNIWVHKMILPTGELANRSVDAEAEKLAQRQPYQLLSIGRHGSAVFFSPGGLVRDYFRNYCDRINAVGNRPEWFPSAVDFTGVELSRRDLEGMDFSGADLSGSDLRESLLQGAKLHNSIVYGADLRNARMSGAYLQSASFIGSNLRGAHLTGADLRNAFLVNVDLRDADLSRADLRGARLIKANLHKASLTRAILHEANLHSADLREADLRNADVDYADFKDADLTGADLRGTDLSKAHALTDEQRASAIT